jgi:dihydrofolate synthase/folylpolyglutamate synthase
MNYGQVIDLLYSQLPMFSRMGSAAFKKDLTNTRLICDRLGHPYTRFKTIHVAGTNGKGSVSHMLAAILQNSGYKTGLYTSPHLYDFRERIRVNGEMVSKEFVIDFVEKVKPWIPEIQPSFFEITVAMAFEYFASLKVDVAIIEVGLGGRLDSTNIITPEVSVITNIGLDHMNMLGGTLKEIANEKAGIIKENVPVVIGSYLEETLHVFEEKAREKNAPIVYAQDEMKEKSHHIEEDYLSVVYESSDGKERSAKTDLQGIYQIDNVRTVLSTVDVLKKGQWKITEKAICDSLKNIKQLTGLTGRWEIIHKKPSIVLEVAHNKDGILQMLRHLEHLNYEQLHIIIGMVKDKEAGLVLNLLPQNAYYYFSQANIPRALDASLLKKEAEAFGLTGETYDNVNIALDKARENAGTNDLIIVCGSIFLVAEVNRDL